MKSYFANSFRVAMEQARKELGPEAMLVTTRASALEARHLGEYEVVFAADLPSSQDGQERAPETQNESPKRASPPASQKAGHPAAPSYAASTPAAGTDLGAMLGEMRAAAQIVAPGQFACWRPTPRGPPQTRDLVGEAVDREVPRELAQRLVSAAEKRLSVASPGVRDRSAGPQLEVPRDPARLRGALAGEIQDAFQVDSRLGALSGEGSPVMVALVGPPGAGKTATIAKLAVRRGLPARKLAVLISLDTLRVGASEQLRCYALLLGLGFQAVETNRALEQSLEEHRHKELILIDTPGFTLSDLNAACDSAEYLARRTDIQKHLVLPASMRYADLARMLTAYAVFRPSRLIFTRIDETETFGAVLSEAISSGRPVSFFCAGQRVPEDIKEADKRDLSEWLVPSTEMTSSPLAVSGPGDILRTAA